MWIGIVKLSLLRTVYFSSAANVLTSSLKIWHVNNWEFFQLNWLGSDQWIWERCCDAVFSSAWPRVLCRFSKGPLRRDFLDIYLTTFSESVISEIQKLCGSSFFSKCSKCNLNFKNAEKNIENFFCFLENCIWIGTVQFSLLRTGYFSSSANVLTSSTKILHVNKRDFFQIHRLGSDNWIRSRCCDADFNSAWVCLPCCLSKDPLKRDFLDIYLTTFSESVISEIQNLWGSSFFSKYSKFNQDFKNAARNSEKVFCFWDNCISIGIVKLSLLRTGYFSLTMNVLTSSPKILHVNKADFFQRNWLGSDHWIW